MNDDDAAKNAASPAEGQGPVFLPIDGILDLHTFRPAEAKDLISEYVRVCRGQGILTVRIIHGKGTGALRRTVEAALRSLNGIRSFRLAGEDEGGWGATIVTLEEGGCKRPPGDLRGENRECSAETKTLERSRKCPM